jgi:hypothetical protein
VRDRLDQRNGAYEVLAAAFVTLADLLGRDFAMATVQPKLVELRTRWGAATFDAVRASYEARRRRDRAAG